MKKPKPSIVLADYKFSDSDMLQYLVNLQRETMKILDEHHEAIEQLERITDEPVELSKEQIKGNYQICEHINLKEWDSKILEVLKNTKICPLCQPKEECSKKEHNHECNDNCFECVCNKCEPKEKSLSETKVIYWGDGWYKCVTCNNEDISRDSNFCPGCGREIIE